MSEDLFFSLVTATAVNASDRRPGFRSIIAAWVPLRGGKEADDIKNNLAKNGWRVDEVRNSKRVSSQDPLEADTPVGRALAEAKQKGFSFLIHTGKPRFS